MKHRLFTQFFALTIAITVTIHPTSLSWSSKETLAPSRIGIPIKDRLEVGDVFTVTAQVTEARHRGYAGFSQDLNWPHLDGELAKKLVGTEGVILHGMHTSSLSIDSLGVELSENIRTTYKIVAEESVYRAPVGVGETIRYEAKVTQVQNGKAVIEVTGTTGDDKQVLIQTITFKEKDTPLRLLDEKVAGLKDRFSEPEGIEAHLSEAYPELEPVERKSPPVYLVGAKKSYSWQMSGKEARDMAALFQSERFSDVKLAKAVASSVAERMFPGNLLVKTFVHDVGEPFPLNGVINIEATVKAFGTEGKKRGRSLTEIVVTDRHGRFLFRGGFDMKAFPYTFDELKALSKSGQLNELIAGMNQYELEMFFDSVLKPDISGVEFIDEYHHAIEGDPEKTLEAAIEKVRRMNPKVLIAGPGGIGGGLAESLGQNPGVELTVLTRDDAGSARIHQKLARAGVKNVKEVRVEFDEDPSTYANNFVDAVYKAHERMGGLDVMFIGTGIAHPQDTLLPRETDAEAIKKHLEVSRQVNFVNQQLVEAVFTAAAALQPKNIFVVGSVHGTHMGNPGVAAYGRSKAAITILAQAYPTPKTKREGAIAISIKGDYILSQMTAEYVMYVLRSLQLGFVMTPKQVAEAATWLIAFHDHEQLGFMKPHRKKTGVMIPDTAKAIASGAHEVAVPGEKSVGIIKAQLDGEGAKKASPPKAKTSAAAALIGSAI